MHETWKYPAENWQSIGAFFGRDGGIARAICSYGQHGYIRAKVEFDARTAQRLRQIDYGMMAEIPYDQQPEEFERLARALIDAAAPELVSAISCAFSMRPVMLEVQGFQPSREIIGKLLDRDISGPTFLCFTTFLIGTVTAGSQLLPFSYRSENSGRLLRAVTPIAALADQASSQGYEVDLDWHQDNANRSLNPVGFDSVGGAPMNTHQAFVTVCPSSSTPMEVVFLDDVLQELLQNGDGWAIKALNEPSFDVNGPASHFNNLPAKGVPLLLMGDDETMHSRLPSGKIAAHTQLGQNALNCFQKALSGDIPIRKIFGTPTSLTIYSNTRCLHRRARYAPDFGHNQRFYLRTYLIPSNVLRGHVGFVNGRVCD